MNEYPRPSTPGVLNQWDGYIERLRVQLPAAPEGLLNAYVRWWPWVSIIFGVFALILLVGLLGLGAILSPLLLLGGASSVSGGAGVLMEIIFSILLTLLGIAGGYLMLKRSATGWWIVAAGFVVGALQDLVGGNLLGLIVTLLFAYVHVQVRPRYS